MRRKHKRQDSLELFLDAVCNMFGGFLFIMLFVVLSIRTTSETAFLPKKRAVASAADLAELETEAELLQTRLEVLNKSIQDAEATKRRLVDPESERLYRQTVETTRALRQVQDENERLARSLIEQKEQRDELEAKKTDLNSQIKETSGLLDEQLEENREKERNEAREGAPPQMRESNKAEIGVILKYGRLYFWHMRKTMRLNAEEFWILEKERDGFVVVPNPRKGIDLNGTDADERLEDAFERYDPDLHKITLVVSPDSYGEYKIVCDFLKGKEFGIRPLIGAPGERVFDRGGRNSEEQ